ncbi:MAG: molybdopterin-dependent oxidoreductase, partial [Firmicutes bacterium]|nr:molybdopterin-dependent oxidoreductase [Bacillota bacterium]
ERVLVTAPDTDYTPFDRGAISDRTTFHLGDAVFQAARDVRRQVLALAAERLEAAVEDLEVRDGLVGVRGVPERAIDLAEVARISLRQRAGPIVGAGRHLEEGVIPLDPETGQSPKAVSHYKFGAQAVRVRVDEETGMVKVLEVASAHDCGKAVNPIQVESQIQGAVAQGIGYALMEEMHFEDGQVMNPTLMDYLVPTAPDVPRVHPIIVERPHPRSPYGVKGVGEPGIIGVAPAIGNAIHHATGVFLADLPMTPERVIKAIEAQGAGT